MQSDGAYAYARASGIIGKSFLGKRQIFLDGLHSLDELERLVFPESRYQLADKELTAGIERRIINRAVRQILSIVNSYSEPPELLVRTLRAYEYNDLKICLQQFAKEKRNFHTFATLAAFELSVLICFQIFRQC
jgi:hypothetical protein